MFTYLFCVCWKLSAAEQVKTDCCHTPAVVSTLLTPLPVSCPLTTLHHYTFIWNRGQKSEILPSVSLATGKLKRCLLHYDVKDECTKIISKNLLLPQYYCNIPCQCVKGSNVVERFYGHTTENTSRLGYKHVCVNYLHVASHDYQYQEVIQHTHWHTHIHTHPHSCLR